MPLLERKIDTLLVIRWSILGILLGMFKMNVVMSISMAMFGVGAILHIYYNRPKSNGNYAYYILIALFAWMIISAGWSENQSYYLSRMRIKLPLLLCPLFALFLPKFSAYDFRRIAYALFILLFIASLIVIYQYIIHVDAYSEAMLRGEPIPVPFYNHIRFSLFYAVGCIFGLGLYLYERNKLGLFLSMYFFIFVHILAVRSGIIAVYIVFAFSFLYFVLNSKKYFESIVMVLIIGTAIFLSSIYIPSLRSKIAYMKYDWEQYQQQNSKAYSDGERINSIMHGINLAKKNLLLGVGEGDVEDEMKLEIYGTNLPAEDTYIKMPHNQFVWTFAATGILGIVLFISFFLASIYKSFVEKNLYLFLFTIVAIASMMVEQTLETQLGVAWFLIPFFIFNQITCPPVSAQ